MGYYRRCNCCGNEFNDAPGARRYLEHLATPRMSFTLFVPRPGETWFETMTMYERSLLQLVTGWEESDHVR